MHEQVDESAARESRTPEADAGPGFVETLAERSGGIAAAAAFGVDLRSLIDTWGTIVEDAAAQPRAVANAATSFGRALRDIWLGSSDTPQVPADDRFSDAAWRENPIFRRVGQSYQAWSGALDGWLEGSGLQGMERERARFVLSGAKDILAPVNSLIGNPEALRRAVETRGASLVKGLRNFVLFLV